MRLIASSRMSGSSRPPPRPRRLSGRALGFLLLGLLTLLLEARELPAQAPRKAFRVGFLSESSATASTATMEAFRQGLRELGYVERQNIAIEWRFAEGSLERTAQLAADLGGGAKVDVVVTTDALAARSLRIATPTVPIILAGADLRLPVIENLARPGRNMSGLSSMASELEPKRMELLKEAVPAVSRVLVLRDLTVYPRAGDEAVFRGQRWGFALVGLGVRAPEKFDGAFATAARERVGAISVTNTPLFAPHRRRLAELAVRHRLAWVAEGREYAEAGSLMSYGADSLDLVRRSAVYVDKVLRGANAGDLPVEQPTRFELVVNLGTARAIGVTIPRTVLFRADHVIP